MLDNPGLCSIRQSPDGFFCSVLHIAEQILSVERSFPFGPFKAIYNLIIRKQQQKRSSHGDFFLHFLIAARPHRWWNHWVGAACRMLLYRRLAEFLLQPRTLCNTTHIWKSCCTGGKKKKKAILILICIPVNNTTDKWAWLFKKSFAWSEKPNPKDSHVFQFFSWPSSKQIFS